MKILVDTNVLLDIVLQREPFRQSSHQVVALCQQEELEGAIAANTIADMFYILRKDFSVQERKTILLSFCEILHVIALDRCKLTAALKNEDFSDFEDCLQAECAVAFNADYIITRNTRHFQSSTIPALSPQEFCQRLTLSK